MITLINLNSKETDAFFILLECQSSLSKVCIVMKKLKPKNGYLPVWYERLNLIRVVFCGLNESF